MKIAVIGATGFVGNNITNELINRNHEVLGISRDSKVSDKHNLTFTQSDVFNVNELADVIKDYDVVVSAYNPGWTNPNIYHDYLKGAQSIQKAIKLAGVKRFIVIGGAGSLFTPEGMQVVDTADFPAEIKAGATAARDYLNIIKEEKNLDWTVFSPALETHPGITTGRTGNYRLGTDYPVFNEEGRSVLSGEDVAVVIADEIEAPKHQKQRFTAAY
ncbi:NAD(P)H-binding protein [Chitinophagaceae bacterium 26-R-25]|nr:NAD(P)H-binding protein [Chitinophagaceae bacterium 26-R-25]